VATLFNPEPAAYLPHRFPFLMLDRVLELKPGVSARARYRTSGSLQVFPQVLLVEAVAQLSGIAAVERQGEGGFWPLLTGLISAAPPAWRNLGYYGADHQILWPASSGGGAGDSSR